MKNEIELKFQLSPRNEKQFIKWLNQNAKFINQKQQLDVYLDNPKNTFFVKSKEGYKDAVDYLRVRKTRNDDSVCIKHWHFDSKTGDSLYAEEAEVNIEDGNEMLKVFEMMGYSEKTEVNKSREIYIYEDYEIAVDKIENLGLFFEVELKKQIDNPESGRQIIHNFLKTIGIKKYTLQERGYVSMLWNKEYDFGREITL